MKPLKNKTAIALMMISFSLYGGTYLEYNEIPFDQNIDDQLKMATIEIDPREKLKHLINIQNFLIERHLTNGSVNSFNDMTNFYKQVSTAIQQIKDLSPEQVDTIKKLNSAQAFPGITTSVSRPITNISFYPFILRYSLIFFLCLIALVFGIVILVT